jgi:hypothetical protein
MTALLHTNLYGPELDVTLQFAPDPWGWLARCIVAVEILSGAWLLWAVTR